MDRPPSQQPPPRRDVSVHIERLVVKGVPLTRVQGAQLERAMVRELTRLIEGRGVTIPGGAVPALKAPAARISPSQQPAALGREIARSIHESLIQPS